MQKNVEMLKEEFPEWNVRETEKGSIKVNLKELTTDETHKLFMKFNPLFGIAIKRSGAGIVLLLNTLESHGKE